MFDLILRRVKLPDGRFDIDIGVNEGGLSRLKQGWWPQANSRHTRSAKRCGVGETIQPLPATRAAGEVCACANPD